MEIARSHPLWQRERLALEKRPTKPRALQGLLLRSEVAELRHIGTALGLQRLARLCDQPLGSIQEI